MTDEEHRAALYREPIPAKNPPPDRVAGPSTEVQYNIDIAEVKRYLAERGLVSKETIKKWEEHEQEHERHREHKRSR